MNTVFINSILDRRRLILQRSIHSHSIVNSRSRFRGKARCLPGENGPDTDRSTVAFESPSLESLLSISLIDGS